MQEQTLENEADEFFAKCDNMLVDTKATITVVLPNAKFVSFPFEDAIHVGEIFDKLPIEYKRKWMRYNLHLMSNNDAPLSMNEVVHTSTVFTLSDIKDMSLMYGSGWYKQPGVLDIDYNLRTASLNQGQKSAAHLELCGPVMKSGDGANKHWLALKFLGETMGPSHTCRVGLIDTTINNGFHDKYWIVNTSHCTIGQQHLPKDSMVYTFGDKVVRQGSILTICIGYPYITFWVDHEVYCVMTIPERPRDPEFKFVMLLNIEGNGIQQVDIPDGLEIPRIHKGPALLYKQMQAHGGSMTKTQMQTFAKELCDTENQLFICNVNVSSCHHPFPTQELIKGSYARHPDIDKRYVFNHNMLVGM